MKTVFVLLIFFLAIGVFVRSYNRWTSVLMAAGVVVALLFLYITG